MNCIPQIDNALPENSQSWDAYEPPEQFSTSLVNMFLQYQSVILSAIFLPPIILHIVPFAVFFIIYTNALCLKAYRFYYKYKGITFTSESWKPVTTLMAHLYAAHGRFWYGYEIEGFENIPKEGPALIIYYHGGLPVDYYYLLANTYLEKKRLMSGVGDRLLFKMPFTDDLMECLMLHSGAADKCIDMLKNGHLLAIAPGGTREAFFGDETYPIIWGKRIGFAKVAIAAKVPIIPVFTVNIREAFFTLRFGRSYLRGLYERTRLPVVPGFGGFPVKLKTIIGEPMPYDPKISAEELAAKVSETMKSMIQKHQRLPGSVIRGVAQRIQHIFDFKKTHHL